MTRLGYVPLPVQAGGAVDLRTEARCDEARNCFFFVISAVLAWSPAPGHSGKGLEGYAWISHAAGRCSTLRSRFMLRALSGTRPTSGARQRAHTHGSSPSTVVWRQR